MKKGYFIHFAGRVESGVGKKITAQLKILRKCFDVTEIDVCEYAVTRNTAQKILYRVPFIYQSPYCYDEIIRQISDPDFIYIRRIRADKYYMQFLKKIKLNFLIVR